MASEDKQGRKYVWLDDLYPGMVVELDAGFTCIPAGRHVVKAAYYIECTEGHHWLEPQADGNGYLIGIYPPTPKYLAGTRVWLKEFKDEEVSNPREQAIIVTAQGGNLMYTVRVRPEDELDDGIREVPEDQIEGLVEKVETGA